jgi:glycosidase
MIEACKYWLRKLDIDGYRFDAVWGVNARCPLFAQRLKTELKSIKPDFLMLAEDKGSEAQVYQLGFDLAYDWARDTSWVSHWPWQYEYHPEDNLTIFNFPDATQRASLLRNVLFKEDSFTHRRLRFMENNDLPRFISHHGLERTKMAAGLLFSLPGVPMLYNGQEVGFQSPLYSGKPIFFADKTIKSLDQYGLFDFYQKLIQLRSAYDALQHGSIHEIAVISSATMVAYSRESKTDSFIVIINLDKDFSNAKIDLSTSKEINSQNKDLQLKDVISNEVFNITGNNIAGVQIPMKGYSTRWLLLKHKVSQ